MIGITVVAIFAVSTPLYVAACKWIAEA